MRKPTLEVVGPGTSPRYEQDQSPLLPPVPCASHLDREGWPHSTGSSPGGAGYKWPCCVPPTGIRHCSQSGWSLQAGCWSGPEGSHGVEPWAGCSRELNNKTMFRGPCASRQTDMLFPARPAPSFLPHFLVFATPRSTAI